MLTRWICENYEIQQKLILSASIQWFWFSVIDKDKNCTLAILYKDKNKTRRFSSLLMLDMNQLFDLVNFFHSLTKIKCKSYVHHTTFHSSPSIFTSVTEVRDSAFIFYIFYPQTLIIQKAKNIIKQWLKNIFNFYSWLISFFPFSFYRMIRKTNQAKRMKRKTKCS